MEDHKQPITLVGKSLLGWYSGSHHPDMIDKKVMDPAINVRIQAQFDKDPEKYIDTLSKGPIADWSPTIYFPQVHFATIYPKWHEAPVSYTHLTLPTKA